MALILQEHGVGRSQWLQWVETVPAFSEMADEAIAALIDFMVAKQILWSDNGILAFAPEGESLFGRKNFMELLSVFTSPPLFRVLSGQKELGFVHESTFYQREDSGPPVLVLAGRSWKTSHLDWRRRIAHVEPSEQRGRSRWFGEGQMLSHRVCQSIRQILSSDDDDPCWSERAKQEFSVLRHEFPWISDEATTLLRQENGNTQWWTFAGGVANRLLADSLKATCSASADNFCLRFPSTVSLDAVAEAVDRLMADTIEPLPNPEAIENLKFSECLPPQIGAEVFTARFNDPAAVEQALREARRVVVQKPSDLTSKGPWRISDTCRPSD